MEYASTVLVNIGFVLIYLGLRKLGRPNSQGVPDPVGFLYQAGGAFTMILAGFFMRDAGLAITCWNVAFCFISIKGYWRLTRKW